MSLLCGLFGVHLCTPCLGVCLRFPLGHVRSVSVDRFTQSPTSRVDEVVAGTPKCPTVVVFPFPNYTRVGCCGDNTYCQLTLRGFGYGKLSPCESKDL